MAQRPTRLPRWAYDAPGGQLVEPPSSYAAAGFYTGEKPPAQWINYQLHFASAWADYLAGPGWGAWTRVAHGGSAPVFTSVTGLAVDTDDTRAGLGRYRYVAVGAITGPAAAIGVSKTGREWLNRDAPSGCDAIYGVAVLGDRCMIWGLHSSTEKRAWQTSLDVGDPSGVHTSDASYWDVCTDSVGNLTDTVAVAYDGTSEAFALTVTGGATNLYRSRTEGQTWPVSVGSLTLAASSVGTGLAWDSTRSRLIIAGSKGDSYTLVPTDDLSVSVFTQRQTLPTAPTTGTIHLRAGGGTCLAWASLDASGTPLAASLLWRSDDGGETWAAVTLPTAIGATLTDVAYADGVWVATTTAAPYLWRSDDGGATWERVQLPLDESSSWALHRAVYADGAVTASGLTWTVQTARATGLAPDSSRVYSPEPGYLADAGYLRGRRIDTTAPTDGQGLVWDASGGLWVPGAAGMANPMTTLGDSIRGGASGAPERVAVGTEGQVWTVVGGVPDWAPAPSGGVDTTLQTPSDGGWSQTGTGTMIASAGVVTLTASGSNTVGALHAQEVPSSPHMPAVELRCRVVATSLPSGGVYSLELGLTNAAQTLGYRVRLTHNGSIEDRGSTTGSWGFNGSTIGAGLDWSAGTTWLRIVATPAYIALFYGTGVGAAPPSTWTRNAYVYTGSAAPAWDGQLSHLHVQATRASGTGDLVVELHDFGLRCLLGAPT